MAGPKNIQIDTIYVGIYDSSMVVTGNSQQFIIVQDHKSAPPKEWHDNPFLTSLIIPILVAGSVAWLTHSIKRKKYNKEVEKLQQETAKLKKSFQPIVVGTLQAVQDKIITSKIDALKILIKYSRTFKHHEQKYFEGEPVDTDYFEYLQLLFMNFGPKQHEEFSLFHDEYSYLFPDTVLDELKSLNEKLSSLNESTKSFQSVDDGDISPSSEDTNLVEECIKSMNLVIMSMRKDCHLDSQFIHNFIEQNQ